ncbi:MAG: D-alanyl-D-alanine carboxypeptidase family protein [Candidatus Limnocylindria bacterium]
MSRAWRRLLPAPLSALIAIAGLSLAPPLPVQAATFTDIAGSPFREDIEWLAARGVTTGCGNGQYCPTAVVTREQMASFLVRMFGFAAQPPFDPFVDDNGSQHEGDINRLFAAGVTTGCSGGLYCPAQGVSREQMATFLARALGLYWGAGNDHFDDDDGSIHESDLDRAFYAGITTGCGARWSCRATGVTREQMAAFLHRSTLASPIGPPGFAEVVVHPTPIGVQLIGPARFSGVVLSADGAIATRAAAFGTIAPAVSTADQTALVNGVRYAHLIGGPMSGTWVKVTPALTVAIGRAPAPPGCTYQDIFTSRQGYDQFATTLLDTAYMLPSWYAPPDLVDTSAAGLNGGYAVRAVIVADLAAMASDARASGAPIQVVSAFRSYAQQAATFQYWVSVGGYQQALLTSARAGHSEHQLGTTMDVTSLGGAAPWNYADWAATPAGAWMAANAWRYGFVMSYEPGMTALACYSYEPWHYRYVGRATAAAVQASGMTLRQAIWAAYGP